MQEVYYRAEKYDKEGLFVFRSKKGDRIKILWWDG